MSRGGLRHGRVRREVGKTASRVRPLGSGFCGVRCTLPSFGIESLRKSARHPCCDLQWRGWLQGLQGDRGLATRSRVEGDRRRAVGEAWGAPAVQVLRPAERRARSGPRNIAEGFARYRHKEFAQFVRIAKASEAEVLNHFIDAHDQRLMTDDEFQRAEHLTRRALKAANGLIRYLESTPDPPNPHQRRGPSGNTDSPCANTAKHRGAKHR